MNLSPYMFSSKRYFIDRPNLTGGLLLQSFQGFLGFVSRKAGSAFKPFTYLKGLYNKGADLRV